MTTDKELDGIVASLRLDADEFKKESGPRLRAVGFGLDIAANIITELRSRVKELEGEQVPLGKFSGWGLYRADTDDFGCWLHTRPRDESDHAIAQHGYVNVELFTAPQKLVVLLPDYHLSDFYSHDCSEFDPLGYQMAVKAAIEATGCTVEYGELPQ